MTYLHDDGGPLHAGPTPIINTTKNPIYFLPQGASIADFENAGSIGYISADGIQVETEDKIGDWGEPIRTDVTSVERTFTITYMAGRRVWSKLAFGIYRLPGDKPLIHNGKARR